jgi:hypothetical protein
MPFFFLIYNKFVCIKTNDKEVIMNKTNMIKTVAVLTMVTIALTFMRHRSRMAVSSMRTIRGVCISTTIMVPSQMDGPQLILRYVPGMALRYTPMEPEGYLPTGHRIRLRASTIVIRAMSGV